ncbi:MAG: MoaD/ThiS family protein [Candidatus Adiutrix sp.]|jgi:sulfur carrier protein ThiS|nr:MoaD/ThiS family protein [Candidatus Adiutrix sp.]
MSITVTLSTTLRNQVPGYRPDQGLTLPWEGPQSLLDVAQALGLPLADIKITMLNGRWAELDTQVSDNDRVAFFPAVGGG